MPRLAAITLALVLISAASAQTPGFWFIPIQPGQNDVVINSLSRDGSHAGGGVSYTGLQGADPFVWTALTGPQVLGDGSDTQGESVFGLTADGQVTSGTLYTAGIINSQRPYRRTGTAAPVVIPPPAGFTFGYAFGMSDDGNVIAGTWRRVQGSTVTPQPFV